MRGAVPIFSMPSISASLLAPSAFSVGDFFTVRLRVDAFGLLLLRVEGASGTKLSRRLFHGGEIELRVPAGAFLQVVHYGVRGRRRAVFKAPESDFSPRFPDCPPSPRIRLVSEIVARARPAFFQAVRLPRFRVPDAFRRLSGPRNIGARAHPMSFSVRLPVLRLKAPFARSNIAAPPFKVRIPGLSGAKLS